MKSLVLSFVCVILIIPVSFSQLASSGGTARNIALGGGPTNAYLDDFLRIHINPALMSRYGERVWGDLGFLAADVAQGGSRGQYIAAAFHLVGETSVGVALNRRESPLYNIDGANPPRDPVLEMNSLVASVLGIGAQPFSRPLSPIEIFWASRFSIADVGASLSYGWWSGDRANNVTSEQSVSTLRFKAGAVIPLAHTMELEAAGLLGLNSMSGISRSATGVRSELSMTEGTEFGADLRLIVPLNGQWSFVPIGRAYWFSWGMKQVRNGILVLPDPASMYSHSEWELGIGARFVKGDVRFVGGIGYQRTALESDYRTSRTTVTIVDLPKINFGVEFVLTSWLTGRVGYFDRLASTETVVESAAGKSTTTASTELPWYGDLNGLSSVQQRITIGIGMQFAGVSIDGTIGEGYFLNGPWPASGVGQAVFSVLSVNYSL